MTREGLRPPSFSASANARLLILAVAFAGALFPSQESAWRWYQMNSKDLDTGETITE
jgi:hypothetical protein